MTRIPTTPTSVASLLLLLSGLAEAQAPGTKLWEFRAAGVIRSTPAIEADGTIYFGCRSGVLYALKADGSEKWECATGAGELYTPSLADDGTIYVGASTFFGSGRFGLFAINPDGSQKWHFDLRGEFSGAIAVAVDGTIYAGSYQGRALFAINPDGSEKWVFPAGGPVSGTAIGLDGTIYAGSHDGNLYAINPDGTKKWSYQTGSLVVCLPSVAVDGTIFAGSLNSKLCAVNPDGSMRWTYTVAGGYPCAAPTMSWDGAVFFGASNGRLYALNPDGTLKWSFPTGRDIYASAPVASEGTVYAASLDGVLYALDRNGQQLWAFPTGDGNGLWGCALDGNGIVYASSHDRRTLYALQGNAPLADAGWPAFRQNLRNNGRVGPLPDPYIVSGPGNQAVEPGETISLTVTAVGQSPMTYQWRRNGVPITDDARINGSQTDALTISPAVVSDSGEYTVTVTDAAGSVDSRGANVWVNPAPAWSWARSAPGSGSEGFGRRVAVDSEGNAYATGHFSGTVAFGEHVLVSRGDADCFVAKYNSQGSVLWAKSAGGPGRDSGIGIAVAPDGSVWVTGGFHGPATFDTQTLAGWGGWDMFLAQYDSSNGNLLWATAAGGPNDYDWGMALAVDEDGNIYVTGQFMGTMAFGTDSVTSRMGGDIFVVKYNPDRYKSSGCVEWVKRAGSALGYPWDVGVDLALDPQGDVYVTGYFAGEADFGSWTLSSVGDHDLFVAKYDHDTGNVAWAVRAGGRGPDYGVGIAVDRFGNSYLAGVIWGTAQFGSLTVSSVGSHDGFAAKLNSQGAFEWTTCIGGDDGGRVWEEASGIALEPCGNPVITGTFGGAAAFGRTQLTSRGGWDIYVAQLACESGEVRWAKQAGGPDDDIGVAVAVTPHGQTYVSGSFRADAAFGGHLLTSAGGEDVFVAKLATPVGTMPPSISCPDDVRLATDPGRCDAVVDPGTPTATGSCPGVIIDGRRSDDLPLDAPYPKGVTTITWTATDAAGSTATCAQTITVLDNEAPVLTCPPDATAPTDLGKCEAVLDPGTPTATDNCPGVIVEGKRSDGLPLDAPYPKGVTTITWTATDAAGSTATCAQTITVLDNEAPVLTCPPDATAPTDLGKCEAVLDPGTPTATDNCPGVIIDGRRSDGLPLDAPYPKGVTMITWTATDASGNPASCAQTVTVEDHEPPMIRCPADIYLPCSVAERVPAEYRATATDNCEGPVEVILDPPSGSGFRIGVTVVTATATDATGNQSQCTFRVIRAALDFTGFLAPIGGADASGGSFQAPLRAFKAGSTIPVKFTAGCEGSQVLTGTHRLQAVKWSDPTTAAPPINAKPQDQATSGNQFRLTDGQWHFNLDTKSTGMTIGKWQLIATLSDGSVHSVWIQLK